MPTTAAAKNKTAVQKTGDRKATAKKAVASKPTAKKTVAVQVAAKKPRSKAKPVPVPTPEEELDDLGLNLNQRLFAEAYIGEAKGNGTRAARLAGYEGNENTLAVCASRLLRNAKVSAVIRARFRAAAMSADEVLLHLARQARGTVEPFLYSGGMDEDDPELAPRAKLRLDTKDARDNIHLLKEVEQETTTIDGIEKVKTKIKLHDPQAALVQLGRHHKLFTDKTEHSGKLETEDVTPVTDTQRLERLMALAKTAQGRKQMKAEDGKQ